MHRHGVTRKSRRRAVCRNVVVLLTLLGFIGHLQAAAVKGLRLWRAPDHTRVVIDLSGPVEHKLFTLASPERVVVDLRNARMQAEMRGLDLQGTPIAALRGAPRTGGDFRVVFDMRGKARPNSFLLPANDRYDNRLVIDFHDRGSNQGDTVKTVADRGGKRDIIIAIDAGHGGEDPGALGPGAIREKHVVMAISREIKKRFDRLPGYRATLIRDGDYYIGLSQRRALARERGADLFLSIHADAFKDRRVAGSSVYTLSQSGASSASARFLAQQENRSDQIGGVDLNGKDDLLRRVLLDLSMTATQDASVQAGGAILRQMGNVAPLHKDRVEHAGFAVLKSPDVPSILVETGFISNPAEARRLVSRQHQTRLAEAIVRGVGDYFHARPPDGTLVHWQKSQHGNVATHRIARGDTLSEIASKYSVSLSLLRRYNDLRNDKIRIGQVLRIPPSS